MDMWGTGSLGGVGGSVAAKRVLDQLVSGLTVPQLVPTYTGPAVFWAPDYAGVFQNVGGLVNTAGQAIPPVAGGRILAGPVLSEVNASGVPLTGMQMVLQPAVTNKCTCRKRNPNPSLSLAIGGTVSGDNLTLVGGTVGTTLTVVLDVAELAAAGLANICNSGYVYKLDNSASGAFATIGSSGATGNLNPHTVSVFARVTAGLAYVGNNGGNYVALSGPAYTRTISANWAPSSTARTWQIRADAGAVVYFILPSMTETMAATAYPLVDVTDGLNAVTFTATDLSYPNPLPVNNWQWRDKVKIDGTPTTDMWLWSDGTAGVYYKAADSKIYYKHGGGTEIATAAISVGNTYDIGVKQSSSEGASISLNQVVTTNAALTANYTPAATLSIGEKGDNTLYFRGRLQQFATDKFFEFKKNLFTNWFAEDL